MPPPRGVDASQVDLYALGDFADLEEARPPGKTAPWKWSRSAPNGTFPFSVNGRHTRGVAAVFPLVLGGPALTGQGKVYYNPSILLFSPWEAPAMAHIIPITDANDPRLDVFARLTEAQLRNKLEPEKGGSSLPKAPKSLPWPWTPATRPWPLLMEERQLEAPCPGASSPLRTGPGLHRRPGRAGFPSRAMPSPGVLCAFRRPALPTVEDVCAGARRVAVLEGHRRHHQRGGHFPLGGRPSMWMGSSPPTCCPTP